jgi:hypothetical protein
VSELKSFKILRNGRILDYRQNDNLDLGLISQFFSKKYKILQIWNAPRHVVGILEKGRSKLFLKLSSSEGTSVITQNEYNWNDFFNKYYKNKNFIVPKNYDSGWFQKKYFYLITDYFEGNLLCNLQSTEEEEENFENHLEQIIDLSEIIQKLPKNGFIIHKNHTKDFRQRYLLKVYDWFEDIPKKIVRKYQIDDLLKIAEDNIGKLNCKVRHGDFTPWHMFLQKDNKLILIDGEHALPYGVENYDICYLIQRVYMIMNNKLLAIKIFNNLIKRGYDKNKLKTVLASRGVGGYLEAGIFGKATTYEIAEDFKEWIFSI